jgi:hypothetical protein
MDALHVEDRVRFPGGTLMLWLVAPALLLWFSLLCAPTKAQPSISDPLKPKLRNLRDVSKALTSCLKPPPIQEAYPGMEMTLRFSFNRDGGIEHKPRITYSTPGAPNKVRAAYERALLDSLNYCTPLPFSPNLGAALAGQPYVIRFIENRLRPGEAA